MLIDSAIPIKNKNQKKIKYLYPISGTGVPTVPEEVVVWVEAESDARFWRNFLIDNDYFKFKIMVIFEDSYIASGCDQIKRNESLGDLVIGCIDSDLNYILKVSHGIDYDYNESYIYSTISYSIENLIYNPELINKAIISSQSLSNYTELIISAEAVIEFFSNILYEPLLKAYYFYTEDRSFYNRINKAINGFGVVSYNKLSALDTDQEFLRFKNNIAIVNEDMNAKGFEGEKFLEFKENLVSVDVNDKNILDFVRGHSIQSLLNKFFKSVQNYHYSIRIKKYTDRVTCREHRIQRINALKNETITLENFIKIHDPLINRESHFYRETLSKIIDKYKIDSSKISLN